MTSIFTSDSLTNDPYDAFKSYIDDFCVSADLDVPSISLLINIIYLDASKVAACFYSGFYLLRYLVALADDSDSLETYIESYCDNYLDDLP